MSKEEEEITSLKESVLCAQVAEDAMEYDVMASAMERVVSMRKLEPLNIEERRLLCSGGEKRYGKIEKGVQGDKESNEQNRNQDG